MKNDKKRPVEPYDEEALYDEMISITSANDCTGLIPSTPLSVNEIESYRDLYGIPLSDDIEYGRDSDKGAY